MDKKTQTSAQAIIYHNPACGTSRTVLAALRGAGFETKVIEYLKDPPDRKTLETLLKRMGRNLREILRKRGTPYEELGLDQPGVTDDALYAAIAEHPILIERPIVSIGDSAALCRPAEVVNELIAAVRKS